MYKILLTDDEQIVIDSMKFIISKNFASEVEVFTALSGSDALGIVSREQIDLIFMDINMPGMNGLDTIRCIKQLKSEIIIVVLSAFDTFQYAQEAMNLGAYKYITKPVNKNTVIGTIRSVMSLIDQQRGEKSQSQDLEKKLNSMSPMVESDFIYSCVFQEGSQADFSYYFDYFGLNHEEWVFISLEFPVLNDESRNDAYTKIREVLNSGHKVIISPFIMNRIVVFYPLSTEEKSDSILKDNITQIHKILALTVSRNIRFGVSRRESDLSKINSSYNQSLRAMDSIGTDGGLVFFEEEKSVKQQDNQNYGEMCKNLYARVSSGDVTASSSFFESLFTYLCQSNNNYLEDGKIKNAIIEVLFNVKSATLSVSPQFYNRDFDNLFSIIAAEKSIEQLHLFAKKLVHDCTLEVQNCKVQKENPVAKKASEFISEHLNQNISLEEAAEFAGVSSFYLSKIFKEEKGVSFSTYLNDRRLEKAKELLSNPELSVKEITAECGYNDQNYFSRLFKNQFGVSPTEYRDSVGK